MKRVMFFIALALCVSSLAFAQDRNTRYIAVQNTSLKDAAGFFAKDIGNLKLGDTVTLVRDSGKWSQVKSGNLTGFVVSADLSTRRVLASGSSNVTASEVALAGKGFSPAMEVEYRKNGVDFSAVDTMEKINVSTDDLLKFINDGRLAKGE
ncbi:MAG: hypothetical protein LBH16_12510 [Treponema sp.]|jgi:hypothetical protein|nr:hypothetical protein [Treponema sp.]